MLKRLDIYSISLISIFAVLAGTIGWLFYNSHVWDSGAKFCANAFYDYWLLIIPAIFLFVGLLMLSRFLKIKRKIASFSYVEKDLPLSNPRLQKQVKIFDSDLTQAFTFGIKSPKIYLSTALINRLNSTELKAVIAHEAYHLTSRHHYWSFLLSFMKNALFFLPVTQWLYGHYRAKIEMESDQEAVRVVGDSFIVAGAILKLKRFSFEPKSASVINMSEGCIERRVKALVGDKNKNCWKKPLFLSLISILTVFVATNYVLAQQAANCCLKR